MFEFVGHRDVVRVCFVCRIGKMSVGQYVLEVLRRNLTNSNHTVKLIYNLSKMIMSFFSETSSVF